MVRLVKNPPANAGDERDTGSVPGLERSPGGGKGNPLQYSCLESSVDRGALWAIVHGVTKTWRQLSTGLEEAHTGIKIARRNINNLRHADDTTVMAENEEEQKSLSMKVKESEKAGLKLSIQKTKIMASGPNTSWQIDGETMEIVTDSILGGSKITTMVMQPCN